jgi:hypothetical protein
MRLSTVVCIISATVATAFYQQPNSIYERDLYAGGDDVYARDALDYIDDDHLEPLARNAEADIDDKMGHLLAKQRAINSIINKRTISTLNCGCGKGTAYAHSKPAFACSSCGKVDWFLKPSTPPPKRR